MNNKREIWETFVAVEGIDGSGTTTLTRLLCEKLKSKNLYCEKGFEPTDGPVGRLIRSSLSEDPPFQRETLAYLFAADRHEHLYSPGGILSCIKKGGIYISDRYFFSSLAYQSLDAGWERVNTINIRFPLPSHLIFLDLPAGKAMERINRRESRDVFENQPFQERVAVSYRKTIEKYKNTGIKILELDSNEPAEYLAEKALKFIIESI